MDNIVIERLAQSDFNVCHVQYKLEVKVQLHYQPGNSRLLTPDAMP